MTKYSLKNKGVLFFFYSLIILMGISAINTIPKQESPDFPTWNAVVITRFTGASPLKVEELISEKVEEKMREVESLDTIKSTSKVGVSYVFLTIKESIKEVKPVWDKVREKLSDLQGTMPQGSTQPWLNNDFGKSKSIVVAITGDGFGNRELIEVAEDLKKEVELVQYVSRVDIVGEQEERIFMEATNAKLAELQLTQQTLINIIQQQNVLASGGDIKVAPQSIRIAPTGEFQSLEDIKKTIISIPGSKNLFFLEDIFNIRRQYIDPPKSQMRFMGQEAVGISIEMQNNGQILELGQNIKKLLEEKQKEVYLGIDFHILNFQPFWVKRTIDDFVINLLQAMGIVAVSMLLLLGWREGLIISSLIPFSFLITLNFMLLIGIPIHQISIAALIISLGMLVDNGIVMTESISGYVKEGMKTSDAAIRASKVLTIPLLTATGTTVAAFLPIALAKSAVGIFTNSITWVVGIVLLSSFFVAMTIIPVLCQILLKSKKEQQIKKPSFLGKGYMNFLRICLRYKYITILVVILVFLGVMKLGSGIRNVFFPPADRYQFLVDFYMPEGTDYMTTKKKAVEAEQFLLEKYGENINTMALYIGEGGPRFNNSAGGEQLTTNYAQFVINSVDHEANFEMIEKLREYFAENYPDATPIVKRIEAGPPVGAPIQIKVYGKELSQLYEYTGQIENIIKNTIGTRDVRNDWGALIPKLKIQVNQDNARRTGVSTQTISDSLTGSFSGTVLTHFREGNKSIPVVFRLTGEERSKLSSLQNLKIPTSQGKGIPLQQVATVSLDWEAGKIMRYNLRRTITLEAYLSGEKTAIAILNEIEENLKTLIKFDPGYGVKFGGAAEKSAKANQSIMAVLPIAMAILVMILVAQFSNVRKMLIILMTIPLSFIGIILGLLSVDYPFGFMALLGVISLAGIVVNNAILLLEQTQADIDAGKSPTDALVSAGYRRSFPIILTTVTTVAGLLPLAMSGEMWGPMAVTIMSGLLISTILTLVVIPTLYSILFRVKYQTA